MLRLPTSWSRIPLKNLTFPQIAKKFLESSLPCAQAPANCSYPKPDQSNRRNLIL
jgi:hypothetical protein